MEAPDPKPPFNLKKSHYIIAAFVLLVFIGIFAFIFLSQNRRNFNEHSSQNFYGENKISQQQEWPVLWGGPDNQYKCQKNESVKYTASPIDIKEITFVEPIGELKAGHIIPGDHAGIDYETSPTTKPVKVFAPADGFLVRVEKHPYTPPAGYPPLKNYHVYLEHSCTFFTGFVHVTEFSEELLSESSELRSLDNDTSGQFKNMAPRIPVKAGQNLGTAWSFGLLGMVTVDLNVKNRGYFKPESYKGENWRIHSVSPFDYFVEPLKSQILAKNPRTIEPRGGKIDFDIEGKLVGNWFLEGTGGFRDTSVEPKQCGNFPCPYWEGHIAFVYDYVDPKQLRVSVGYQSGLSGRTPFGVKGNGPDFKEIGVEDGLVKYELVGLKDISRERGYITEDPIVEISDDTKFLGTMLVQVVDDNTIRVEIFPGKSISQVLAFTPSSRIYHR